MFCVVSFVLAFTLAVTFQLAHCLEEAEFSSVDEMTAAGRAEWARHQIETTVDFAPRNRVLAWYLGGLNFQVEHHLFSARLPHPLPGDGRGGPGGLRAPRHPPPVAPGALAGARVARALAAADGRRAGGPLPTGRLRDQVAGRSPARCPTHGRCERG